ncbi:MULTISPECIES: hypothetical protein [Nocardia]|nr:MULTISPECIES: hypothetical protein [Nocardia]
MRGKRVLSCESVSRLDYAVPVNRPDGVGTTVVVAVAPSRLSGPVIGRAQVIVDYLEGQGLAARAAHARALHPGALWTVLHGAAVGGVVGPVPPVIVSSRRHRWLPGFGTCHHPRLLSAALTPLAAAVVLAVPVAHAAPAGQPGVISEPGPGQVGVTAPTAPHTPDLYDPADPGPAGPVEQEVVPAPERNPEPLSPAPQEITETPVAPEPAVVPELPVVSDTSEEPQPPVVVPDAVVFESEPPPRDMVSEPQLVFEPERDPVQAPSAGTADPEPQPVLDGSDTGVVDGLPEGGEERLYFGGISVPQPEWMTPQAAEWEQGWNEVVVAEAVDALAQGGITDPAVETVLGVDTEPVPIPEAAAPIVEAIPEPVVNDVEAAVGQPVADLAAVVEPSLAQVVNDVLPHWPPTLG